MKKKYLNLCHWRGKKTKWHENTDFILPTLSNRRLIVTDEEDGDDEDDNDGDDGFFLVLLIFFAFFFSFSDMHTQ